MYQEDSFKTSQVVYAHTRSDEADMEYKMHCHNSYEIYYMVKGNVEYFLEGTSYVPKPGSLLIIPPNCFHGLRVLDGSEYHRIRLHFVPELLTEKEKKVVTLYYYEDLTLKEISNILEVSEPRVSQLHTRALQKMKTKMGDYMGLL